MKYIEETQEFVFEHSLAYQKLQHKFSDAVDSGHPENIIVSSSCLNFVKSRDYNLLKHHTFMDIAHVILFFFFFYKPQIPLNVTLIRAYTQKYKH